MWNHVNLKAKIKKNNKIVIRFRTLSIFWDWKLNLAFYGRREKGGGGSASCSPGYTSFILLSNKIIYLFIQIIKYLYLINISTFINKLIFTFTELLNKIILFNTEFLWELLRLYILFNTEFFSEVIRLWMQLAKPSNCNYRNVGLFRPLPSTKFN